MRLPSLRRTLHMTLGGAVGAALALNPSTVTTASANVEVGATAGLHTFSVNNELGVPDIETATSLRNSALFGLRLGVGFGDMLGVEAEVGLIPTEERNLVYDVWVATYRAHVIAQFGASNPNKKLIPFALVGGGLFHVVDSGNEDRVAKDKDEGIYVGIGAKYRVENGWGLRLDGRWIAVPSSDADASGEANKGQASDFEVLLSVYKEFGRKTAPKEEVVEEPPPDNDPDKDGVVGDADGCPNDPEDADGFEDDNGCPDPDNDGDGVADAADQCPDKLETKNGYQDGDGCPDEVPAAVKKFTGVIKGINFKTGSAEILKSSNKTLNAAVKVMTDYPDLKLEIQGHTDDVGDDTANQELSQARADSVKAYFEGKGIQADRLISKGYGETAPTVDPAGLKGGKLKAAQAKNRRVEFKLVSELTETPAAQP